MNPEKKLWIEFFFWTGCFVYLSLKIDISALRFDLRSAIDVLALVGCWLAAASRWNRL